MRLSSVLCGLLWLAGGFAQITGQDEKTYDLRGPAPAKGQVLLNKMNLKINDANTTVNIAGEKPIVLKTTMNVVHEREQEILEVEGRSVSRYRSKIVKDRMAIAFEDTKKQSGAAAPPGTVMNELEGESILSERIGGSKWKHSLADTDSTEKKKKELDNLNGFENDDDSYPAEKVKLGDTWKSEAKSLTRLFDDSFSDLSGEMKRTFLKLEEIENEECAVVQSTGLVKGKMKDEAGEPSMVMEMDLKLTSWRSLKSGIYVKEQFEGKIKLSGTQKVEDEKVKFSVSGPFTGESGTKIKR
jgi:hypothetical protein